MAGNWKEPWEMTKAEYNQSVDKSLGTKVEDWAEQEEARMRTSGHPVSKEVLASSMRNHKEIVQQALVEGKPVPTEVLKDYPERNKKVVMTLTVVSRPGRSATLIAETAAHVLKDMVPGILDLTWVMKPQRTIKMR